MESSSPVLVHGATGFTGRLVCAALAARSLPFAVSGRNEAKLRELERAHGCPIHVVDLRDAESIVHAIRGRAVVLACAGPFLDLGEPILATCAREGIAYADTTGEQRFVADMALRYRATAEARRACIAPSLAYEIAPGDWAAHEAARALGGTPERVDVAYLFSASSASGYGRSTTRGTKRAALRVMADDRPMQFIEGLLRVEAVAAHTWKVDTSSGKTVATVSIPSPEAVLTPLHTRARTVRTFMAMGGAMSSVLHRASGALGLVGGLVSRIGMPLVDRTTEGPEGSDRNASFEVVARAVRGDREATVRVTGRDPYGLTAEIQALFAARVLAGNVAASGIVAPSQAIAPDVAFEALAKYGLTRVA